jgi:hypothetical protein
VGRERGGRGEEEGEEGIGIRKELNYLARKGDILGGEREWREEKSKKMKGTREEGKTHLRG